MLCELNDQSDDPWHITQLSDQIVTISENMGWAAVFLGQIKLQYPDHEHIVIWDGEGFHPRESDHTKIPSGIHPILLPPYSP